MGGIVGFGLGDGHEIFRGLQRGVVGAALSCDDVFDTYLSGENTISKVDARAACVWLAYVVKIKHKVTCAGSAITYWL